MKTEYSCTRPDAKIAQLLKRGMPVSAVPPRYMPILEARVILMKQIHVGKDVFFVPKKGLVLSGRLGWNTVFIDIVVQTVNESVGNAISEELLLQLVVRIYTKVSRDGGRFLAKIVSIKQIPDCWEEMSIGRSYRIVAKCIGAVAKKDGIEFPAFFTNNSFNAKLSSLAQENKQAPSSTSSTGAAPIIAKLTDDVESTCDLAPPTNETLAKYSKAVLHRIQQNPFSK